MWKSLAAISILLISANCSKVFVASTQPTPVPTVNPTDTNKKDIVSFRVLGNAIGAKIRYSNSVDGLDQLTTTLPFQETVTSTKDNAFFYLEATANGYPFSVVNPFLSIQIIVNGNVFREASTTSSFFDTITVSGTYHRS